jgi:hypothetical protein
MRSPATNQQAGVASPPGGFLLPGDAGRCQRRQHARRGGAGLRVIPAGKRQAQRRRPSTCLSPVGLGRSHISQTQSLLPWGLCMSRSWLPAPVAARRCGWRSSRGACCTWCTSSRRSSTCSPSSRWACLPAWPPRCVVRASNRLYEDSSLFATRPSCRQCRPCRSSRGHWKTNGSVPWLLPSILLHTVGPLISVGAGTLAA